MKFRKIQCLILCLLLISLSVSAQDETRHDDKKATDNNVQRIEKQRKAEAVRKKPNFVPSEKIKSDAFIAFPVDI